MEILFAYLIVLAAVSGAAVADPAPTQDFCVADLASEVKVNGYPCKDPAKVTDADFYTDNLAKPLNTSNIYGFNFAPAFVDQIPGINTLGVSLGLAEFAPGGIVPPHTHQRATEIVFVVDGTVEVGFITTGNVHIARTVEKGGVFVVPRGLVHFLKNVGKKPASVLAAFDSQLPGVHTWPLTLFRAEPPIAEDLLATSFQITTKEVQKIKAGLAPKRGV